MSLFKAQLPHGRRWARVGDFFEITRKPRATNLRDHASVPFVPMDAIPQGGGFEPRYETRPIESLTSGTYFERGDLLVAKITPSFENGKQAITDCLPAPFGYASTEVIPLRPRGEGQDKRLLFFYLLHPEVRSFVAERMEGATGRQRVPEAALMNLPYPEMALSEQYTISELLLRVLSTSILEERGERVTRHLKRLTMHAAFSRGLRKGEQESPQTSLAFNKWTIEPISMHHKVSSGSTPSRENLAFWSGGTIPWVKTSEVNYCVIQSTEENITPAALKGSATKLLEPGTLLMAMYGQGVTRGRVAILGIKAACNQACAAIQAVDDTIDSKYLYHFLAWRYEAIRNLAHGGQQQNLNLDIVRALPIAYPSDKSEQHEIVAILDAIDRKIALHQKKRAVLDKLFKTLLHKLMTGEINVADLDLSALASSEPNIKAAA